MSGRKYKPALIELVSKGSLKPRKGVLGTPKWFYSGKKEGKPAESGASKTSAPEERKPVVNPTSTAQSTRIEIDKTQAAGIQVPATQKWRFDLDKKPETQAKQPGKKLQLSVSYWVIALTCLALLLGFLVMYRLGQRSVNAAVPTETQNLPDAPVSSNLEEIQFSPIREDLLPETASNERIEEEIVKPAAPAETAAEDVAKASFLPVIPVEPEKGICLQICFNTNPRDLRPVQEHFNTHGVETLIGQNAGTYILYSRQCFEKSSDPDFKVLKDKIKEAGATYNSEKPAGAVSYLPSTFASAYPINVKDITK